MQNNPNINLNELVQQIHILYPYLPRHNERSDLEIREKLQEQLVDKVPQVELEHLDLKYIIMNVKKSLSEFQRRIDESVAQQQLRRTTRVRKTIHQDPAVVSFFNRYKCERKGVPPPVSKAESSVTCTNSKCTHQVSDLGGLVQVESLPVSASTNLLTIFVPSILQEKLHSCKYKISIDLNRLDLTKQILDLNVEQQVNSNLETDTKDKPITLTDTEEDKPHVDSPDQKVTYEIKGDIELNKTMELVETQSPDAVVEEPTPKSEVKDSPDTSVPAPCLESTVSIVEEEREPGRPQGKKRGPKRKDPKPPSNDPPKKRGRKPGSKNKKKDEKSELAKYVEMFACTAGSPSAVSQIVTSTTQNWDVMPEQGGQIAYFMNGEWTLGATSNGGRQLVSTTNGLEESTAGQETFIPFEDFVNFIENPSLDAGNNVIARVLDGSVDTPQASINSQESTGIDICVEIPEVAKCTEPMDVTHPQKPTLLNAKPEMIHTRLNTNIVHSTASDRNISLNDGVLDLSKEHNISLNVDIDVLDLTQKKSDTATVTSMSDHEAPHHTVEKDPADRPVIFSTNRSMPSLDDMEEDIFCSAPPEAENMEKNIIFSIAPQTSSTFNQKCLHSPERDSLTDSAIEVEKKDLSLDVTDYSKTSSTAFKDKTKTEVIKGMSLLEIEKDFDDSLLDFENCMDDDLLSLAPSSCFNSPNEDRFSDSNCLAVEEPDTRPSTSIDSSNPCPVVVTPVSTPAPTPDSAPAPVAVPVQRSHLEISFNNKPKEEEPVSTTLKNFKIPRMKKEEPKAEPVQARPLTQKISKPQNSEIASSTTVSSTYSGGCSKTSGGHASITMDVNFGKRASSEIVSTREISKMFGSLCYGFLADKCFEITCRFSHQLLDPTVIVSSLCCLRNEVLHSGYRFIWRHHKLFKFYFPIFCDEYARRNMRRKLSNMVSDCEIQPNCLPYLRNIYSALIISGLNKINACRFILSRVRARSHVTINLLLEIIIESDAAMFCNTIEQFSYVTNYKFQMKDINALAAACLGSGSAELITVLIKCLISVDQAEFIKMKSPELIQLLEMVKNGGVNGL